jgi:hypothetical protein
MSFSLSLTFSPQQNQRTRGQKRFCPGVGVGGGTQNNVYIHVNKCKNDKTQEREKKKARRNRHEIKNTLGIICILSWQFPVSAFQLYLEMDTLYM